MMGSLPPGAGRVLPRGDLLCTFTGTKGDEVVLHTLAVSRITLIKSNQ